MEIRDFMLIAAKLKKEMAAHKAEMKKASAELSASEAIVEGTRQKHNLEALEAKLTAVIEAQHVKGEDGLHGRDGKDGKDGKAEHGRDGKDGKDGVSVHGKDGRHGRDGVDGKDGKDGVGVDGKDGKDGKDSPYITSVDIDFDNRFTFRFNDGSSIHTDSALNIESRSRGGVQVVNGGNNGNGSGGSVEVVDESDSLTTALSKMTFVGAGVTASEPGADGEIVVTIAGGAGVDWSATGSEQIHVDRLDASSSDLFRDKPAGEPIFILSTGQSNPQGYEVADTPFAKPTNVWDFGTADGATGAQSTDPLDFDWRNPDPALDEVTDPVGHGVIGYIGYMRGNTGHQAISCAIELQEATGRDVYVLSICQGGADLNLWKTGERGYIKDLLEEFVPWVLANTPALADLDAPDILLWGQSEASGDPAWNSGIYYLEPLEYVDEWQAVQESGYIEDFPTTGWRRKDTPTFLTEPTQKVNWGPRDGGHAGTEYRWEGLNAVNRYTDDRTKLVSSVGLPLLDGGTSPDDVHYSGDGNNEYGRRIADAILGRVETVSPVSQELERELFPKLGGQLECEGFAVNGASTVVATAFVGSGAFLTGTPAYSLKSATTSVVVSAATAPTDGQVLTASSGTAAAWETPSTAADGLNSATTTVSVSAATAPTNGQVLTASNSTTASWEDAVGSALPILDEGNVRTTDAASINFTGTGVTATDSGSGHIVVNVPGGVGGSDTPWTEDHDADGYDLADVGSMNFTGEWTEVDNTGLEIISLDTDQTYTLAGTPAWGMRIPTAIRASATYTLSHGNLLSAGLFFSSVMTVKIDRGGSIGGVSSGGIATYNSQNTISSGTGGAATINGNVGFLAQDYYEGSSGNVATFNAAAGYRSVATVSEYAEVQEYIGNFVLKPVVSGTGSELVNWSGVVVEDHSVGDHNVDIAIGTTVTAGSPVLPDGDWGVYQEGTKLNKLNQTLKTVTSFSSTGDAAITDRVIVSTSGSGITIDIPDAASANAGAEYTFIASAAGTLTIATTGDQNIIESGSGSATIAVTTGLIKSAISTGTSWYIL